MGRPTVLTVAAGIVVQLDFSPIITLPTMTFAMPRAFQAFLCGYAGPVSAIDLGGVAGCLVGVLMVLIDWPTRWTLATLMNGPLFLATLGFVFGALYWLGARLMAPNAHAWRRAAEAEAASAH